MNINNLNKFIFDSLDDATKIKKQAFEAYNDQGYLSINDILCLIHKKYTNYPDIYINNGWSILEYINLYEEIETRYYDNQSYDFHIWVLEFPPIINIENKIKIKEKENDFKWKQKYLQN